jgi:kinetochore protein NDC80
MIEKKDERVKKDLEKLNNEYAVLEKEWNNLSQNEAPKTVLEREKAILESDREKFKSYIAHVESKKAKLLETVKSLQQEFDQSEQSVKKLSAEREDLAAQVDAQDLSPADVDRMK